MRTLYRNAHVITMDPTNPRASAFLVENGRFVAVGSDDDLAAAVRAGDRTVNLGGRTVVPGLIDAHVHFAWFAFNLVDIDLTRVGTREEVLGKVAERVRTTPTGDWIRGYGFDANTWGRWPTYADLDAVAPDHPVALSARDGHSTWVNSLAMRLAGVTSVTESPAGGHIVRDGNGQPTGIFQENAAQLIRDVMPQRSQEERLAAYRLGMRAAAEVGVTGMHDMEPYDSACFCALQRLDANGELTVRFSKAIPESAFESAVGAGLSSGFGNEWLRIGWLKLFSDGSLGSQTAHLLDAYEGRPGYFGVPTHSQEEMEAFVGKAVQHDMAVAIHAIGDAANRSVLNAFAAHAAESQRRGLRHRLEHAQLLKAEDLPRFAELGIIASVQPSHAPSDRYIADKHWGARARLAYAFKSLLRSGARMALGSDVPVEPLDPLAGIHAAVWRKRLNEPESAPWYPEERLTVAEALHGFTLGAAYASGEEALKGSITPGKLADFVVLSQDISTGDEETFASVRPVATVVGGRSVFGGW